ncbi:hypothetical protein KS4_08790 [Poriferisphaera corsica]|uniref:Uncharacterized protein n=1 Tax=Poriferisphaera corsica TaxID=2528020 RepID=A0A517YRI7_9BACT|nr:hypothetical protein [Poriferisphaera corsica]QDU32843.1 hypothetical protein KS4_08790 [Poriferisphaera corsica]
MQIKPIKSVFLASLMLLIAFTSSACKKESSPPSESDIATAQGDSASQPPKPVLQYPNDRGDTATVPQMESDDKYNIQHTEPIAPQDQDLEHSDQQKLQGRTLRRPSMTVPSIKAQVNAADTSSNPSSKSADEPSAPTTADSPAEQDESTESQSETKTEVKGDESKNASDAMDKANTQLDMEGVPKPMGEDEAAIEAQDMADSDPYNNIRTDKGEDDRMDISERENAIRNNEPSSKSATSVIPENPETVKEPDDPINAEMQPKEPVAPPVSPILPEAMPDGEERGKQLVKDIEENENYKGWYSHQAIEGRVELVWMGAKAFEGVLAFQTNLGAACIDLDSGELLVYDGNSAWLSPTSSAFKRARFHLLTWPYFITVGYKLSDPGVNIEYLGEQLWKEGESYPAFRMTFGPNVGDTPDDWYVLYVDTKRNLIVGMNYIVTYGTTLAEAEKEVHAISYDRYQLIEGVDVPWRMTFWHWDPSKGITDKLGELNFSSAKFITPGKTYFQKPENSREDKIPNQ